jgi:hypothetical protein
MKRSTHLFAEACVCVTTLLLGCNAVIDGSGDGSTDPGGAGLPVPGTGAGGSGVTGPAGACGDGLAPTRIWRLNDRQLKAAVQDLLPSATAPQLATPGRDPNEFVSWEDQFPVQQAFATLLSDAAYAVAKQAAAAATTCAAGQAERDCAANFIDSFVSRAYRRPLADQEKTELLAVYDIGAQNGSGLASGIESVIAATLQAPSFLYRTELGSSTTVGEAVDLTAFELATSLSFLFLNSIPDAALWQAALDGSLTNQATLEQQVDRLLTLPRAQENLTNVLLGWAGVPRIFTIEKTVKDLDGKTFDEPARQSMEGEVRSFLSGVLWSGGTITDLFGSRQAQLDPFMATFYGVSHPGQGTVPVELPADRAGVLARAGTIAAIRYGTNPEVFRGQLLRTTMLCGEIPPPPPTVNVDDFNAEYGGLSTRERIAVRSAQPACQSCHVFMDTLGIAYDGFGALGQPVTLVNGVAANPAGELTGTDIDGPFANLQELSQRMATSQQVRQCMAKQLLTYALGRDLDKSADTCATEQIAANVATAGNSVARVFRELALTSSFKKRSVGASQ